VRANLLELTAANDRAALLQKQLNVQEQIAKLLEQRLAAGAVAQPELTTARIALNKTLLDLGDAKSKRAEARARLAQSIGLSADAIDGVEFAFDFNERSTDELTSKSARGIALRGRSDVLGALADYAASEAELRLQVAKQFPDVHLNPGYQFDQGDNKWTLGISVELPVLNQNQGPIAEARAQREVAAARFIELQAGIIGEIDRAIAAERTAQEQLATSDQLLDAEEQQRQSVEAQLKAGAADPLDALSAQLELGMSAVAHLDGQMKWQQSLGALEDALQRPIQSIAGASPTSALTNIVERAPDRSEPNK
jgi:outer membrane protein TolC